MTLFLLLFIDLLASISRRGKAQKSKASALDKKIPQLVFYQLVYFLLFIYYFSFLLFFNKEKVKRERKYKKRQVAGKFKLLITND